MQHVTERTLRRLAEHRRASGTILSLYLDLDPSTFSTPEARDSQLTSLVNEAEREVAERDAPREEREEMRRAIERVRALLVDIHSDVLRGARSVAIFCAGGDVLEVVPVHRSVERRVVFADAPYLEPLAELIVPDGWVALLVNRRVARILRGTVQHLEEVVGFQDHVHRKHDQGGWSQARYQRSVEQDVQNHVKRTTETLFEYFKREPFDHLVVGAPVELLPEVEEHMHPDLRERFVERLHIDVEHSAPEDVQRELVPVVEQYERARDRELLERLTAERKTTGRGAIGPAEVLEALNERRVSHLLFLQGASIPGAICPTCGWLRGAPETCPIDGTQMQARDNIIDHAIKVALAQAAEVRAIREPDPAAMESIAALLRF